MKFIRLFLLIYLCFFSLSEVIAKTLSLIETKIAENVKQEEPNQLLLLQQLVNINSGTQNLEGVYAVGKILEAKFAELGFKTYWVSEPPEFHRAASLIAEHKGTSKNKIVLIGHLDTVFPKTTSFQHFERIGNTAKGPGVVDDKGGDVVLFFALKALYQAKVLDNANITVVLTGDEEDAGKPIDVSRKFLKELAKFNNIALDFESAVSLDTASIARRGVETWILKTNGKEAHSSQIFKTGFGYGAIFELARILNDLRTTFSQEKYLTLNPGVSLGGTTLSYDKDITEGEVHGRANIIAKQAIVRGDLRFLTPEQKLQTEKKMIEITHQNLSGTSAEVSFQNGIPSMPPTANNLKLLNKYSEVSQDLKLGQVKPLDVGRRGAGDIAHVSSIIPANLVGLGPMGSGEHTVDETLNISSLTPQTQRAALLIYRLIK